jgi:putative ABC transport system permease protein
MQVMDMSWGALAGIFALLAVPALILRFAGVPLVRQMITATGRMTVQLVLVALYLEFIFRLNNIWVNISWVLAMIVIANLNITRSAGLRLRRLFPFLLAGLAAGTLPVIGFFVCIAVRPEPFYDARYLIPISGMVLGNCLRANVIALERFYSAIRTNAKEFITYLSLGATRQEACRPYMRQALQAAIAPTLSTMATMGLVSLPGMMTGQILGGSSPMTAIKYQIAVMLAIFCATVITAFVNIHFSQRATFTPYGLLDPNIFSR